MSTWQLLTTTWNWHPSVLLGCAALVAGYLAANRREGVPVTPGRLTLWLCGVGVLLLALVSPLDELGDRYLFSVHMLQHLLLLLAVPPLLLAGLPPALIDQALRRPAFARGERILGQPGLAWPLAVGTLWAWHLPLLYDAALSYQGIHIAQHLTFLVTGCMFWWPVMAAPRGVRRLGVPVAILYLFAASLASAVLGIILTFAPSSLYGPYLNAPADSITHLLRSGWGLDPTTDQQIGGLLMWIPGGLAYLLAICGVLARWYGEPETDLPRADRSPAIDYGP